MKQTPKGWPRLSSSLFYDDAAAAIDWLCRAFDFQVKRGEETVAGTDSKNSIASWDKKGWTEKLRAAVQAASSKFSGPLKMPYEPWHYEYRP